MSFINKAPTLFGANPLGGSSVIRGVTDPNGLNIAINAVLDTSGIRCITTKNGGDMIPLVANTEYTIKFSAKLNSGTDDLYINLSFGSGGFNTTVSLTNEWAEYTITFMSDSSAQIYPLVSVIRSSANTINVDLHMLRIYPSSEVDPIDAMYSEASELFSTDFSGPEYTTGQQPSDWTLRHSVTNLVATVTDDAGFTGGKYMLFDKSGFDRSSISWDAIHAGGIKRNGVAKVKFSNLGDTSGQRLFVMARATGADSAGMVGSAFGIYGGSYKGYNYSPGHAGDANATITTPLSFTPNALLNMEVVFFYDAVFMIVWEDANPRPEGWHYLAGTPWDEYTNDGWVGLHTTYGNNVYVDTFEFESGSPLFNLVEYPSGLIQSNGSPVDGANVDFKSMSTYMGTRTFVERVVTGLDGIATMTVEHNPALGYQGEAVWEEVADSGTVSSSTSTSLTDTTKTWSVDQFGGSKKKFMVKCTPAVGATEERTVISNTGNTIEFDRAFSFAIDGLAYEIVEPKSGSTEYFPPQA